MQVVSSEYSRFWKIAFPDYVIKYRVGTADIDNRITLYTEPYGKRTANTISFPVHLTVGIHGDVSLVSPPA